MDDMDDMDRIKYPHTCIRFSSCKYIVFCVDSRENLLAALIAVHVAKTAAPKAY